MPPVPEVASEEALAAEDEFKSSVEILPLAEILIVPPVPEVASEEALSAEEELRFSVVIFSLAERVIAPPSLFCWVVLILPRFKFVPEIVMSRPLLKMVSATRSSITKLPAPSPSASAPKLIFPSPAARFKLSSLKSCRIILLVAWRTILVSPDNSSNSDS